MSSENEVLVRQIDELDISAVVAIDERIGGAYRPEEGTTGEIGLPTVTAAKQLWSL